MHFGGDGFSEGVRGAVDGDAGTVDKRADFAAAAACAEAAAMVVRRDDFALVGMRARPLLVDDLLEDGVDRDESELPAFPNQFDLPVVGLDLLPVEVGCFAESEAGEGE
jgi:hypothetical protein